MPEKEADLVKRLQAQLRRREEENVGLSKKIDSLESENKDLSKENRDLKEVINRAKDISPWSRPNLGNVKQLAKKAFLDIVKAPGGWQVLMGSRIGKKFKRLRDIWLILTREEWSLHDEFIPTEATPTPTMSAPPSSMPATRISLEEARAEVLRAEWRLFPSKRKAIEERMARFDITVAPPAAHIDLEEAHIEVLRAEWRLFPSMRKVLEEQMAKFGIVPEPT